MARQRKLNTPEKRARVGERIKVAATQAGLSLKELAEQAEVSPSAIYQYVRGITAVPVPLLERIALVTQIHASFFDPEQDARQTLALPVDAPAQELAGTQMSPEPSARARFEAELRQARTLAEAYRSPHPDRAAYLSALEQMLALSRALDGRERHAAILAQIGRARLEAGQLAGAQTSLMEARELLGSEPTELRGRVMLDLARCLMEREEHVEASHHLEEIASIDSGQVRWQAEVSLGRIRFQHGDYPGALRHYGQAAEAVLAQNSPQLEREAQRLLAAALAQLSSGVGHFEAARTLWGHVAQWAERDRDAIAYVEAMTELSRCEEARGDLPAARTCLERVMALMAFWQDVENRQVIARGILAQIQATLGEREAARENARLALRVAHRDGRISGSVAGEIALGQIRLAAEQYAEALEYAREALDEARRNDRAADLATAHLIAAQALYGMHAAQRGTGNPAAEAGFRRALSEAKAAAEAAERGRELIVRLHAQWMVADLYEALGADREAEIAASALLDTMSAGPVALKSLLNTGTNSLLELLSAEIDLPALFHTGAPLDLPSVEWQVHTLLGTLADSQNNPEEAYASYLQAAQIVWRIVSRLTLAEANAFHRCNPRLAILIDGLQRTSAATRAQAEVRSLLERLLWSTEQPGIAVVGAESLSSI